MSAPAVGNMDVKLDFIATTPSSPRTTQFAFRIGGLLAAFVMGVGLMWWLTPHAPPAPPRHVPAPLPLDPLAAAPHDFRWIDQPQAAFPIPPYARFLRDARIVLDPGHVGQKLSDKQPGWKTGPTGLREPEANLRVAKNLAEFLSAAGAEVRLTRAVDVSLELDDPLDLQARAEVANAWPADLLLSIHHNASDSPTANHTLVFYHGLPDESPPSLDAGRHVLAGLNDALRLERHVECALVSDLTIHPKAGFAVLRHARVPAILTESSFHSNPDEEQRLRDPLYNRREAYGMFIGLARWAQAGLPRIRLLEPADGVLSGRGPIIIGLDDGFSGRGLKDRPRLLQSSIRVRLNGRETNFTIDLPKRQLSITPPLLLRGGSLQVYVDFENVFGQHVIHPWIELTRPGGGFGESNSK